MKTKLTRFLSALLVAVMCMGTLVIGATGVNECEHVQGELIKHEDPTCVDYGYDLFKCLGACGKEYADNYVNPLGHDTEGQPAIPHDAICPGVGNVCDGNYYETKKCKRCDTEVITLEEKDTAVHWFGWLQNEEDTIEKDGTLVPGYSYLECDKCGLKVTPANDTEDQTHYHKFEASVKTEPTCDTDGVMIYTCVATKMCRYSYEVPIKKTGHDVKFVAAADGNCKTGAKGNVAHYLCKICNKAFEDAACTKPIADVTKAPAHKWTNEITLVQPNCTTKGVIQHTCSVCGISETEEKDYKHSDSYTLQETKPTCVKYGYKYYFCDLCGALDHSEVLPPVGHSYDPEKATPIEEHDATCTEMGYKVYQCDHNGQTVEGKVLPVCDFAGGKVIVYTDPATGHDYKDVDGTYVAPQCGVAGQSADKECQNEGCTSVIPGTEIPALVHTYEDKDYKVTCLTDGYTISECKYCGQVNPDASEKKNIVKCEPDKNHDMAPDPFECVDATCDKDGIYVEYCKVCDKKDAPITLPKTGHKYSDTATFKLAGTCSDKEIIGYPCENGCGGFRFVEGDYDRTAAGHEAAMEAEGKAPLFVEILRQPTCEVKGLLGYHCTKCDDDYTKQIDNNADGVDVTVTFSNGKTGVIKHHEILDDYGAVTPDCTTKANGYLGAKYCKDCAKYLEERVVDEFKHTMVKVNAQKATCTADGWEAYEYCSVCEAAATKGPESIEANKVVIKAHGDKYIVKVDAKDPTCTADGNKAYEYCSECTTAAQLEKLQKDNAIAKYDHKDADGSAYILMDTYTKTTCDEFGGKLYCCYLCGDKYVTDYEYMGTHTWDDGVIVSPDCDDYGYVKYTCTVCGDTAENVKGEENVPALGHVNAAGEKLDGKCTSTYTDDLCKVCNVHVTKEHEWSSNKEYHEASCRAPEGYVSHCTLCNESYFEKKEGGDPQIEHTEFTEKDIKDNKVPEVWVENTEKYVPATTLTKGQRVYNCKHCGEEKIVVLDLIPDIGFQITHDNGIVAGYNIVNGGLVEFKINLALITSESTSLLTTFKFDPKVLTFVDAKIADIYGEGTGHEFHATKEGVLSIYSIVSKDTTGNLNNVKLEGSVEYATVTFKVNPTAANVDTTLVATGYEMINAKREEVFDFQKDKEIEVETVEISQLGNTNGDQLINTIDAQAIRQIITGELVLNEKAVEYLAEADINFDGVVTLADFAIMSQYLVGKIDALVK